MHLLSFSKCHINIVGISQYLLANLLFTFFLDASVRSWWYMDAKNCIASFAFPRFLSRDIVGLCLYSWFVFKES